MALELFMIGLIVQDMHKSLEFYRRLGLAVPEEGKELTHVQIKMGSGLTFFLDSQPSRWDPELPARPKPVAASDSYKAIFEYYLQNQNAVNAKYQELTDLGYRGRRAPYNTSFKMRFALIDDPDGNTILLSGDLR